MGLSSKKYICIGPILKVQLCTNWADPALYIIICNYNDT